MKTMSVLRTVEIGRVSVRWAHDGGLVSSMIIRRDGGGAITVSEFSSSEQELAGLVDYIPVDSATVLLVASMLSILNPTKMETPSSQNESWEKLEISGKIWMMIEIVVLPSDVERRKS